MALNGGFEQKIPKMEPYQLEDYLKRLPVDLRAEVVARELKQEPALSGYTVSTRPQGSFGRSIQRDIAHIHFDDAALSGSLQLITCRESLTDMIPPGIIFQPVIDREERTTEIMLESSTTLEEEFQNARLFFTPFDMEIGHQRILLEEVENQALTNTHACFGGLLNERLWPAVSDMLTPGQKALLLELTIQAGRIAGDLEATRQAFEKMLDYPVQLSPVGRQASAFASGRLGQVTLGADWIPFQSLPETHHLKIALGPLPVTELVRFRYDEPVGSHYRLLCFLCDLLLPVEYSWEVQLLPGEGDFQIGKKEGTGILGYSTLLG